MTCFLKDATEGQMSNKPVQNNSSLKSIFYANMLFLSGAYM